MKRRTAPLRAKFMVSETLARIEFDWAGPSPVAGQFFMLKPERSAVFLARPLSAADWGPGWVGFLTAIRGPGTAELAALALGERVELIGPLGNGWPRPAGFAALVGGGLGVAPVAALARGLAQGSYDFYAGFKSTGFGLEGLIPRFLVIASEDGSVGNRGRIPDALEPEKYAAVYACGPEPMLRVIARACKNAAVPCFVSMERPMACGVGACRGCAVKTSNGIRRCCVDGPVFNAKEVVFDEYYG